MRVITTLLNHKRIFLSIVTLLILSVGLYAFWLPHISSREYLGKLDSQLHSINELFHQQAKGARRPLFNSPSLTFAAKERELKQMAYLNAVTRSGLDSLASATASLKDMAPGTSIAPEYQKAVLAKSQAQAIIAQSRDVLNQYDTLVAFLHAYYKAQHMLEMSLDSINTLSDLNILAGRHEELTRTAIALRQQADVLMGIRAPLDLDSIHNNMVSLLQDAAKGFDRLAHGIYIAVDSEIYGSAGILETVTTQNYTLNQQLFSVLSTSSVTMQNVLELPQKTDGVCSLVTGAACIKSGEQAFAM